MSDPGGRHIGLFGATAVGVGAIVGGGILALVGVAATVRTPGVCRILLLSVVRAPAAVPDEDAPVFRDAQTILSESLQRGFERATAAETLFTVAPNAWVEIARVARLHRSETVLLGAPRLSDPGDEAELEVLLARLDSDVVVVRAPRRWRIARVRRVLVPMGGQRDHSRLRARLLASLTRSEACAITFLRTVPPETFPKLRRRWERELRGLAGDEVEGPHEVIVEEAVETREAILRHALDTELVVMGIRQRRGSSRGLGARVLEVARDSDVLLILLGSRSGRPVRPARRELP